MTAAGMSIVDEVGRMIQERSLLKQRAITFDETTQRCQDALWALPDGLNGRSVAGGAAG